MRICYLFNNDFTFHTRAIREVESLLKAGYEVTVFCTAAENAPVFKQDGRLIVHRLLHKRLYKYHFFSVRLLRTFTKILFRTQRFDIVQANDAAMLPLGWLLSRFWGAKLIYDSHEYWEALFDEEQGRLERNPDLSASERRKKLRQLAQSRRFEAWILPRCNAVISVSDSICRRLEEKANGHIKHCLNLRNIAKYQEVPNTGLIRQHFNLSEATKVVVYQGQIAEKRGLAAAVDAMEFLEGVALVLMGPVFPADAKFFQDLQDRIQASPKLRETVFYKGFMPPDELLHWTASADLGLQPILNSSLNHYYCLPNKIFEYIQAGLPIAVSHFPELQQIVTEYQIGFTFNPENPREIAQKIRQYFDDAQIQAYYKRNVQAAKTPLSWESEEQKLISLYEEILGREACEL